MNWSQAKALVTGGASGLGQAVVKHLLKRYLITDSSLEQPPSSPTIAILDKQIAALVNTPQSIAIATDVSSEQSVMDSVTQAWNELNGFNLVINCAGIVLAKKMLSQNHPLDLASFEHVIRVNLMGTYLICQASAEKMQQNEPQGNYGERGVIINTASIAAFEGQIGQIAYSASKGAIVSMALPMAREMAQYGIRVMTIAPGLFSTQLTAGFSDEVKQQLNQHILFPKQLGEPEMFAQLVQSIFENPYLNGSTIRLDGGLRMPEH